MATISPLRKEQKRRNPPRRGADITFSAVKQLSNEQPYCGGTGLTEEREEREERRRIRHCGRLERHCPRRDSELQHFSSRIEDSGKRRIEVHYVLRWNSRSRAR